MLDIRTEYSVPVVSVQIVVGVEYNWWTFSDGGVLTLQQLVFPIKKSLFIVYIKSLSTSNFGTIHFLPYLVPVFHIANSGHPLTAFSPIIRLLSILPYE